MTADEDEAQQVVAHVVLDRGVEIGRLRLLLALELPSELLVLALGHRGSAEVVYGTTLPDRHEPGARVVRDA
jgi:hypothetical protein